jgi:hypothetical protein
MENTENDWLSAGAIAGSAVILVGAFFWATSNRAEQLPMVWARLLAFRFLLAVVLWALTIFSNRRKLGLRTCFELGALLLIGSWVFSLGRILGDGRVSPTLAALRLGSLSTAMFVGGACIAVIALNMAVRLIRLPAILQRS